VAFARRGGAMNAAAAARVRDSPAVVVLDSGAENVNRVVRTREFGLVIDRRRKPQRSGSALFTAPTFMPQPFFEHDVLHGLNTAGASFVQAIHYADDTGLIIEYAEGRPPTQAEWDADVQLRREYSGRFVQVMGELAAVSEAATPSVVRADERGIWPVHLESTAQYGRLMCERTVLVWNRVVRGWTTHLLSDIGGTASVSDALAGFELTGDRPVMLLHNDLHLQNTIRQPFKVIDWTNASPGDALWAATQLHLNFPAGQERDQFLADLRAKLPAAMARGFEHDWGQYKVLERQRTRTVAGGLIRDNAMHALEAASHADTPAARRDAVRPYAEKIHGQSLRFADQPTERTLEETTDLVMEHISRQLDLSSTRGSSAPQRSPTRDRAFGVGAGDAARTPKSEPGVGLLAPGGKSTNSTAPSFPGLDTSAISAGFAPVGAKLPAPGSPAPLPPAAVNSGPGRIPSQDQVRELRPRPATRLSRSLGLGS
jgi:hypothetical protein